MTTVAATSHPAPAHHDDRSFIRKYVFSTDHKIIGIQFLFVSLFFLLVGGLLAMQMRWQLGFPGKPMPGGGVLPESMAPGGVILPEYYIQLLTMHGTFMVFFAIMPLLVGVYANFLIPLKIGTHDMAFPRINMWSFWSFRMGRRAPGGRCTRRCRRGTTSRAHRSGRSSGRSRSFWSDCRPSWAP